MIKLKNILSELHEPGHEEGKMAKAQAYELMKDAEDVCRMIGDSDNLPEWLEAKITLVVDKRLIDNDCCQSEKDSFKGYEDLPLPTLQTSISKVSNSFINCSTAHLASDSSDISASIGNTGFLNNLDADSSDSLLRLLIDTIHP